MLIATLFAAAGLVLAVPQNHAAAGPPADDPPAAAEAASNEDACSVELVDGELVFQASLFETLTDEELSDYMQRFPREMRLPENVFVYPDAERHLHTFRWDGSDPAPLRQRLKEVLHFERNSRELEFARQMRLTATLDFKGGTLGSYIDSLVQHFALPKPVFDPPELRKVTMPAVQLNRLDLASAFSLPGSLALLDESKSPIRVRATWVGPGAGQYPASVRSDKPLSDYRQSVCIISRVADKNLPSAPELRRAVFNLIGEKGTLSSDELRVIMAAIQLAIDLDGPSTTFRAKYHEPSGLLIVQGTNDELGVAAQVVRAKLPQARIEMPGGTGSEQQSPPYLKDIPTLDKVFKQPAKP